MDSVLKAIILPSSLIATSALAGLVLSAIRSTRLWGIVCSMSGFACYVVFASGPVAFLLLGHLEYQVEPSRVVDRKDIHTVVVLAAHAEVEPGTPLSSWVNDAAAIRLLEAMSLYHLRPDARVIVSGGGVVPSVMRDVLVSAGVSADHIELDAQSYSTFESARNLAYRLGKSPFLLVTSAGHMPRAMGVFKKNGMAPVAVPTHYLTRANWLAIQYFPSPLYLAYSDLAVSEYAAWWWYQFRGWV